MYDTYKPSTALTMVDYVVKWTNVEKREVVWGALLVATYLIS